MNGVLMMTDWFVDDYQFKVVMILQQLYCPSCSTPPDQSNLIILLFFLNIKNSASLWYKSLSIVSPNFSAKCFKRNAKCWGQCCILRWNCSGINTPCNDKCSRIYLTESHHVERASMEDLYGFLRPQASMISSLPPPKKKKLIKWKKKKSEMSFDIKRHGRSFLCRENKP